MTSQQGSRSAAAAPSSDAGADGQAATAATVAAATAAAAAAAAGPVPPDQPWGSTTLQHLRAELQQFAAARNWGQFHTPRNLLLALTGEMGELAEIFQWRGEVAAGLPGFTPAERQHVGEELSDVLLYLVRLADACGVDLPAAALAKMQANGRKYPVERAYNSAAKYTQLAAEANGSDAAEGGAAEAKGGQAAEGGAAGDGAAERAAAGEQEQR